MSITTVTTIILFMICVVDVQTGFCFDKGTFVYKKPEYIIKSVLIVGVITYISMYVIGINLTELITGELDMYKYFIWFLVTKHAANCWIIYMLSLTKHRILVKKERSIHRWEGLSGVKQMLGCILLEELFLIVLTIVACLGL